METGKPDEVGNVGEEIVGPLTLPPRKSDILARALSCVL